MVRDRWCGIDKKKEPEMAADGDGINDDDDDDGGGDDDDER